MVAILLTVTVLSKDAIAKRNEDQVVNDERINCKDGGWRSESCRGRLRPAGTFFSRTLAHPVGAQTLT